MPEGGLGKRLLKKLSPGSDIMQLPVSLATLDMSYISTDFNLPSILAAYLYLSSSQSCL